MRSSNSRSFIALLSLLLVVLLGVGTSAFAQGKGKGGGGGNKGGGGGGHQKGGGNPGGGHQKGGGNPGGGGGGHFRGGPPQARGQQQHAQPQRQQQVHQVQRMPQMQRHVQMQRPERGRPHMQQPVFQTQRQQPNFERKQKQHQQKQMHQPQFDRPQQPQQQAWDGADRGRGRGNKHDRAVSGVGGGVQWQEPVRGNKGKGKVQWNDSADDYRGNVSRKRSQMTPTWDYDGYNGYNGYKNYGQQRSAEVHARNAERKAWKSGARSIGGYFTGDDQYWFRTRVIERDRDSWRDNILRSVIGSVIASNFGGNYYDYPQYSNSYYSTPYYGTYGYNNDYPHYYSSYGPTQYYDFYSPYYADTSYGYGYSPSSYYVNEPYYANYYANDIGLPNLSTSSSFGGFVGRMFSELIALGYNQGYQDAVYARSQGHNTRYYDDPYDPYVYTQNVTVFEDVGYNPYSCFGQNRRYVSEGYELGYRDALYGNNAYDPYDDGTNVDLVSVLISTVALLS